MKKKKRITERNITMFAFSVPATVLYILFFIYPVGAGIYYSLTDWNGLTNNYHFIGIKNYVSVLRSSRFQNAIRFNFKYTILLVVSIVGLSLIMALILNSKIKAKSFFRGVYFFPAVVSMLTVGLIFNEVFFQVLPPIGQLLHIEWMSRSLLSSSKTAIYAILITNVWQGIAIPTVLLMAGLQNVPQELVESASLDGARKWDIFKSITFPFLLPVLTVVTVLVIKDGLTIYDYIVALTNGGPGGATESTALLIYNHGFKEVNFSLGIAEAVIVTVIICFISFIQIAFSNKKSVY
ncbi:MAG TPA: sugar ABC transporter permease [Lachnospiraceae bacterium]|jgi:raffinose/stachyose/melibiose transport system permease protein|nr:sugar ABC transporter permease [Lachnospiraceae bacterium]HCM13621.1 sugar ABC transporter permease [Lachnospiraceae bacterium]HCR41221.1 sugar ABC transporter permease [Lachnospiraceae bacterium]